MTHVAFKHIEPFRRVLAVLLLALATACAHAGDNPPPPRFDGLYVSSDAAPLHTSYMRFFPDGSVAMVSVSGPSTPQQVAAWLSPSHPFSAHGSYQVQVDRLSLSVTTRSPASGAPAPDNATTSYQGLIRGDAILLDRGLTDDVSIATYRFAAVNVED
jgi:hypothetical protein